MLRSRVPRSESQELLDLMEQLYATYTEVFGSQNLSVPRARFEIYLYKNEEEYVAAGAPPDYEAYYSPQYRALVGYHDPSKAAVHQKFAHEGVHQFCDMFFGGFDRLPPWFAEGIAECFASFERKPSGIILLCRKDTVRANTLLIRLQEALKEGKTLGLADLLRLSEEEFTKRGLITYPQAWSWCQFLMSYPEQQGANETVPQGKYSWNLWRFIAEIQSKTGTADDAFQVAFQKTRGGEPIDLDKLEEEWRRYILGFRIRGADYLLEDFDPKYEKIKWTRSILGRYVAVRSNGPEGATRRALNVFDALTETCRLLFKIPPDRIKPRDAVRRPTLLLFAKEADYRKKGFAKELAAASGKYLATFVCPDLELQLVKAGVQQFLQLHIPGSSNVPVWLSAGLSSCAATGALRDGRWWPFQRSTPGGRSMPPRLAKFAKEGQVGTFDELAKRPREFFVNEKGSVLAWAMCDFLWTYPAKDTDEVLVPRGKFADTVAEYLEGLTDEKKSPEEAWKSAFTEDVIKSIESDWKTYFSQKQ